MLYFPSFSNFSIFSKEMHKITYLEDGVFCIKTELANLVITQLSDGQDQGSGGVPTRRQVE